MPRSAVPLAIIPHRPHLPPVRLVSSDPTLTANLARPIRTVCTDNLTATEMAAPLARVLGAFTGSGVRQATFHGPTPAQRAVLAEATRQLGAGETDRR